MSLLVTSKGEPPVCVCLFSLWVLKIRRKTPYSKHINSLFSHAWKSSCSKFLSTQHNATLEKIIENISFNKHMFGILTLVAILNVTSSLIHDHGMSRAVCMERKEENKGERAGASAGECDKRKIRWTNVDDRQTSDKHRRRRRCRLLTCKPAHWYVSACAADIKCSEFM